MNFLQTLKDSLTRRLIMERQKGELSIMAHKENTGGLAKTRRTPDEPREVIHCSKSAYRMALFLERKAEAAGIWPSFELCFPRIAKARQDGNLSRVAFLKDVLEVMQAREGLGWDTLYVLSDKAMKSPITHLE